MSKLLTMVEASEYLGVSKLTLYGWVSARKVSFIKVGRLVKFKQEHLAKWIDQHTVKAGVRLERRQRKDFTNGTDETI
jgi:excisionase family DNA binding protein